MIWLCLIIPVITVLILVLAFHKHMAWWEYFLVIVVPTVAIVVANYTAVHFQTQDTEYWNTYGTQASYYEKWNEWITKTCSEEVCSGSGDNRSCTTRYYDCSYEETHPPRWKIRDNMGNDTRIDRSYFAYLVKHWGNKTFQDMNRSYYTYDGDAYHTTFKKEFEKIISLCKTHTYENKVMVSKSVFNFQEVDSATITDYGLYEYPKENVFDFDPILGDGNVFTSDKLNKYNALNGSTKQLHMMILIFKDKPYDAGMMQESYWKGGNKNEFVLCVGIAGKKIKWTKVISWTDEEALKAEVNQDVLGMDTLNIMSLVDYMGKEVPPRFVRKKFEDFDYLKIEPSFTAVMITLILTILISAGIAVYVVMNEHVLGGSKSYRRNRF